MYQSIPKDSTEVHQKNKKTTDEGGDYIVVTILEQTHLSLSSPQIFIAFADSFPDVLNFSQGYMLL